MFILNWNISWIAMLVYCMRYIGEIPVSIKPMTYKSKNMLQERIDSTIIYYDKVKDGIKVELDF